MTVIADKPKNQTVVAPAFNPWLALVVGVLAGTFAAPFIKLSQENGLPSPVIAFGRMGLAALALTPLVLRYYPQDLQKLTRKDLIMAMFGGAFLVTHFMLMIFALENATTLVVLVIVNTGPLWVALLERIFLKEQLNRFVWVGMFITIAGSFYIALNANSGTSIGDGTPMLGAILSFFAAIAGAAYMIVGRTVRRKVSLFPYVWVVFSCGGILGLIVTLATGTPIIEHPSGGYFWLIMLTLLPQLIGHSAFNFALRYFTATLTSLSSQLLTITGSIVAFFIFAEVPTLHDFIGSAVIALGVLIAILNRTKTKRSTSEIDA
ncbi:MAG: DMT family transporter [Phototrophicaceae bacterium]